MISINYRDPRPIYEQVKDGFRQLIFSGILKPDEKLPSVRELAGSLAINPNTIQRAYRELELEGCICSVPGKGSFVADLEDAAALRQDRFRGHEEDGFLRQTFQHSIHKTIGTGYTYIVTFHGPAAAYVQARRI